MNELITFKRNMHFSRVSSVIRAIIVVLIITNLVSSIFFSDGEHDQAFLYSGILFYLFPLLYVVFSVKQGIKEWKNEDIEILSLQNIAVLYELIAVCSYCFYLFMVFNSTTPMFYWIQYSALLVGMAFLFVKDSVRLFKF